MTAAPRRHPRALRRNRQVVLPCPTNRLFRAFTLNESGVPTQGACPIGMRGLVRDARLCVGPQELCPGYVCLHKHNGTLRNYLLSPNGTYRRGFRPKSPSGSLQDRETLQVDRIAHREATRRTLRQRRPCAGRQQRSCRRAGTYHAARELSACVAHVVRRQHARAEYMSGLRRDESRPIALGGHHWSATECLPRTRTAGMSTKKRMAAS